VVRQDHCSCHATCSAIDHTVTRVPLACERAPYGWRDCQLRSWFDGGNGQRGQKGLPESVEVRGPQGMIKVRVFGVACSVVPAHGAGCPEAGRQRSCGSRLLRPAAHTRTLTIARHGPAPIANRPKRWSCDRVNPKHFRSISATFPKPLASGQEYISVSVNIQRELERPEARRAKRGEDGKAFCCAVRHSNLCSVRVGGSLFPSHPRAPSIVG
jgi:hypothetical protein